MQIEPDTKIMQTNFGSHSSLKSREVMGTLTSQAKGIQEFVVDAFNDLPNASQPAAQGFGPMDLLAALMRRRDQVDLSLCLPALVWSLSGKALVSYIGAVSRPASARQTRRWTLSSRKQGRGQVLIMRTSRAKAKACNHAQGSDTQQQMKAFIPAEAITPANISLTCQPSQAASLGITGDSGCTIQRLIGALLAIHELNQMQAKGRDCVTMLPHESVELRAMRQLWKGCSQMLLGIAVKGSFAGKLGPLSKHSQCDDFAALQRSHRTRSVLLLSKGRLAIIIDHHVQCWKVGIHIDHQLAPFLTNWFDKLTLRGGYPSFQVLSISHQTL
jgi:hypothetical protein